MENLQSAKQEITEEESKEKNDTEWSKQFETKTSFVLKLDGERLYNFTLESVI